MKKIECYIVQDLLPLYIDHACSKQTTEDIEGHLQSCESCKKLYEEMSSDICSALQTPEFDSRKIFCHAKKSVLAIILALAAVISCFVINAGGAWMGGRADISNLIVTILYVIFWSVFSVRSRGYVPLIKVSFAISCITFVSAAAGLIARALHIGGIYHWNTQCFFLNSLLWTQVLYGLDWTVCNCNGIIACMAYLHLAFQTQIGTYHRFERRLNYEQESIKNRRRNHVGSRCCLCCRSTWTSRNEFPME